jgi:hypothetical protein
MSQLQLRTTARLPLFLLLLFLQGQGQMRRARGARQWLRLQVLAAAAVVVGPVR